MISPTTIDPTQVPESIRTQAEVFENGPYQILMLDQLRPEQKQSYETLLRDAAFGEVAGDWCQMLQSSGIKNFSLHYLPIFLGDAPQALAIFYLVKGFDAAKYLSEPWSRWLTWLARLGIRPFHFDLGFLDIPFTNLPGLLVASQIDETERSKMIVQLIEHLKTHVRMHALLVKADPSEMLRQALAEKGLIQLAFAPNTLLELPYESFDEYLASLPRKARWDVKDKIRKFERAGGVVEVCAAPELDARQLYDLLMKTCDLHRGTKNSWPIDATPELFENLSKLKRGAHRVLLARMGEKIVGFLLLVRSGSTLYYKFCGLDYQLSAQTMAYFNLFYAGIRYAMENHCRSIYFGPTAYFNKERLGCKLVPVDTYIEIVRGILRWARVMVKID